MSEHLLGRIFAIKTKHGRGLSGMNLKKILLLLFLLSGSTELLIAQTLCGTPQPTETERMLLLTNYQAFLQENNSQKQARVTNYRVAIKANILQSSNAQMPFLNETDVRQIIENANNYLKNINVELYLLNNQVNYIKEDKFYELKLSDENELRKKYDVLNAINIYFVRSIILSDLSILGGYTNLPTSTSFSNRIFYSFFDRTTDDFNNLKNKLFLHEIGHYFGLLHTFQDSNHADVSKRELVTRGTSSNCYIAGDQLCDTPSDPFERLTNVFSLDCSANFPNTIVDALGETYSPPISNIMSYHKNCGHTFTTQQYLKMQASFSIRFSPAAEYQIIARSPNFIEIHDFEKKAYCQGDSLKINFDLEGLYETNNQLSVELSDKNGNNFSKIETKKLGNQLVFIIPSNLPEGDHYRVRITASRPETISPISEHFAVRTYATANITAPKLMVNAGDAADLYINFTGSGTWSFDLSDGTSYKNIGSNPYRISRTINQATSFWFTSVKNVCGEAKRKEGIKIDVQQPQILTTALSTTNFCKGQSITLTLTTLGQLALDDQYVIQLSDRNGANYTDLPTQTSIYNLTAQIPDNQATGSGYRLKIITKKSQYYSSPIGPITIIEPPLPPSITPISLCQNSTVKPNITTSGANSPMNNDFTILRWYASEFDLKPLSSFSPNTAIDGFFTYYATQMNTYGCESKKAKVNVTIKPMPIAYLTGDKTIMIGDSALLNVDILAGDFPVTMTLSDGRDFNVLKNPLVIQVRPKKTTTYNLKQVKNNCGVGSTVGTARIVVMEPLGEETSLENFINVYPNPAFSENIQIKFTSFIASTVGISLSDNSGRVLQEKSIKRGDINVVEQLDVSDFPAGSYILKVSTPQQSFQKKIIIQK